MNARSALDLPPSVELFSSFFFFFFFCCKDMNIAHSFFSALSDFLSASFLAFSLLLRLLSL